MRYFLLSLKLSLRGRLRQARFWAALILVLALGTAIRWNIAEPDTAAVQAGVVLSGCGEEFWEALEARSGSLVHFIRTDEATARIKVSASQWDCALLLDSSFTERLEAGETEKLVTLLIGPGSTVYPLIRETAAAALLELSSAKLAGDYLFSSGITSEAAFQEAPPRLTETLPQSQRVQVEMETLEGRPLTELSLTEDGTLRILRGTLAAVLLAWTLFAAIDLGRWRQSGAARRMLPCLGGLLLSLPHLTAALLSAFLMGAAGIISAGCGAGSILALPPYLAALGALALLLSAFRTALRSLPAAIPFAAASVFVLSPVFADITLFFPGLLPLSRWLPATLYLQGCEGDWGALIRLLVLAAVFFAAAAVREDFQPGKADS